MREICLVFTFFFPTEPKSPDLRKLSTQVIIDFFELNPQLFSRILSGKLSIQCPHSSSCFLLFIFSPLLPRILIPLFPKILKTQSHDTRHTHTHTTHTYTYTHIHPPQACRCSRSRRHARCSPRPSRTGRPSSSAAMSSTARSSSSSSSSHRRTRRRHPLVAQGLLRSFFFFVSFQIIIFFFSKTAKWVPRLVKVSRMKMATQMVIAVATIHRLTRLTYVFICVVKHTQKKNYFVPRSPLLIFLFFSFFLFFLPPTCSAPPHHQIIRRQSEAVSR